MSEPTLTPSVCASIEDHDNYLVLVSRPSVRVTKVDVPEDPNIGGFAAKSLLTIVDESGVTSQVVLPHNAEIGSLVMKNAITDGDVIRIDQMVRIPRGDNQSVVVVHSVDVITEDFELKLTDMDKENRQLDEDLQEEMQKRQAVETCLRAILPPGVDFTTLSPDFRGLVRELIVRLNDLTTEAMN